MSLVDLIIADGYGLKKAASTNGGEWSGPCPFCGGRDRFRVWPRTGRYWCRGCGKAGDAIQYLRDARGMSFHEACGVVGRTPEPRASKPRQAPAVWAPRQREAPSEAWQKQGRAFIDQAIENLWTPAGASVRRWLRVKKGLSDVTIKRAMLGYVSRDLYASRAAWGLPANEKKVWLPAGLVIPLARGNVVHRLRIRRTEDTGPRYVVVSGSSSAPMVLGFDKGAVVVVESELDGLLLQQAAGDLCGVVALGNAQAKPDTATHELLQNTPLILVALDSDEAGAKASWDFWSTTYGKAVKRWPCLKGKDISDAWLAGLNLRQWLIAGLFGSEERFERFAIMTIDGGVSDVEAMLELQKIN